MDRREYRERTDRPGLAESQRTEGSACATGPTEGSNLPESPGGLSAESLQAAREAMLNPRQQLRNAVALQVGQLNEVGLMLARFQGLMEAAGMEWSGWLERNQASQEATGRFLRELAEAKGRQEEALVTLRHGVTAAKDEDTVRLEAGLRNLAAAAQELRTATATVNGAGKRFSDQVSEAFLVWEGSLISAVNRAWERMEEPVQGIRRVVRPLTWVGGCLGILIAVDVLLRVVR